MDPDGNNVERLTSLSCVAWPIVSPVWSPDGESIAFGCHGASGYNLCITSREGLWPPAPTCFYSASLIDPEKVPVEFCYEYRVHSVSWAPDGKRLAFTCPYRKESTSSELVCIIDLNGKVDCWPVSVISGKGSRLHGVAKVDWSPTADLLALSFQWFEDETSKIYLTDLDGQNSTFLVEGWNPRWSSDGERLLFFQIGGRMSVIDQDGSNLQCIYDSPENPFLVEDLDKTPLLFESTADWSPDGRFIAFAGSRGTSSGRAGIYILNLRTNEVERITILKDGFFSEPDWSP
jgi:Tol biopolymer transport system component